MPVHGQRGDRKSRLEKMKGAVIYGYAKELSLSEPADVLGNQ